MTYLLASISPPGDEFEEYAPCNIIGLTDLEDLHIMVDKTTYEKVGDYIYIYLN